jgi:hypothetical protein
MPITRRHLGQLLAACMCTPAALARAPYADLVKTDRRRVLSASERYLREEPVTLVATRAVRSPGGPHDYYSEADYWWPNPADPNGPYIQRDGYSNPEKFTAHREAVIRLSLHVPALVAAWRLTGDERFARHAERHLDAWFVDDATRMAPHLNFAQAIIGKNTGRGIGVIDTLHLVEVAQSVAVLGERGFRLTHADAIRRWFGDYLNWMTTSKNGTEERDAKNNHGSCWALQAAEFARLVGDHTVRDFVRERFRSHLVPLQIAPDGRQPLELARTKPYSYALFNLEALATLAHIASDNGDLWRFEMADGRSLAKALAYMVPFVADKTRWPLKPDVEHFDDLPVREISLLFGGEALDRPEYVKLWSTLNPDPQSEEIIRNFPIRQPLLWF